MALTEKAVTDRFKRSFHRSTHRTLRLVGRMARRMGYEAYLVGGIVRDTIIGFPDTDLDIVIEGDAEKLGRRLASQLGGTFSKPTEFGTCKVEVKGLGTIDFATARTEVYSKPGALPVVRASDIARDLWRRDFTINAMAVSLSPGAYGSLFDPCGGLDDLRCGLLRVMHDKSFEDDPTRVIRGVRFAARYAYRFERHTLALLRGCLKRGCLGTVSGKRVYRELGLVCAEGSAADAIAMLESYGVTRAALGAATRGGLRQRVRASLTDAIRRVSRAGGQPVPGTCWFAHLFVGIPPGHAGEACARLNLPAEVRDACIWGASGLSGTLRSLARADAHQAYAVTKMLRGVSDEGLVLLAAAAAPRQRELVTRYLRTWRYVAPRLTGGEIASLGPGPGPHVGRILDGIVKLRLEGSIKTRKDELAYARRQTARLTPRPKST
jgi:tRNA nucleotidyltransferase (CCA-adding enzyme)